MLYYILPPFIIIISVSALIVFLFRKVENIPASEVVAADSVKQSAGKVKALKSALSHLGLNMLEKMVHRSKLLSLKFHNASNEIFHSIREKRKQLIKMDQEVIEKKTDDTEQISEIIQAKDDDRPRVREMVLPAKRLVANDLQSNVSSTQRPKPKAKDKLEEALIKRIAMNPRDIEAYERLGDYYLERENHHDSLECFKQVLKLSPAHHKARTRIRRLENMLK